MASTTLAAVDFLVVDDADWRRVFDFCFWMMLCVFFFDIEFFILRLRVAYLRVWTSRFSLRSVSCVWSFRGMPYYATPTTKWCLLQIRNFEQVLFQVCMFDVFISETSLLYPVLELWLQHHWTTWCSARALNFGQSFFWLSYLKFVCERIVFRM